jgi:HAD superfamily hydrolase (TIGR01509 family)
VSQAVVIKGTELDLARFDAVIFDCDGVIADSEPVSVAAWTAATFEHGLAVGEHAIAAFIGSTERTLAAHFGPLAGVDAALMEASARTHFLERVARTGVTRFPDTAALMEALTASGVRFGVGSNSPRWRLDAVLEGVGIGHRVPVTVAGDEVVAPKPAADVYLEVARRLDVDSSRCVVIEDTPTGIRAAASAGSYVVGVYRGPVSRPDLAAAAIVVDGLWPY